MSKSDYIGKICPYCKTELAADDEIVTCSLCDMPHHKECWIENQGCTTFGCMGTIKTVEDIVPAPASAGARYEASETMRIVYCTKCGAPSQSDNSFCGKCGTPLVTAAYNRADITGQQPVQAASPYNQQPYNQQTGQAISQDNQQPYNQQTGQATSPYSQQPYNQQTGQAVSQNNQQPYNQQTGRDASSYSRDYWRAIGSRELYYDEKFKQIRSTLKAASWNWRAFLFAPYWLIYRKMYGPGFGILAVLCVFNLIGGWLVSLAALAGRILIGIFGNRMYMKHIDSIVDQAGNMSEPDRSRFIDKEGGTSVWAVVLSAIGYGVLTVLLSYL